MKPKHEQLLHKVRSSRSFRHTDGVPFVLFVRARSAFVVGALRLEQGHRLPHQLSIQPRQPVLQCLPTGRGFLQRR